MTVKVSGEVKQCKEITLQCMIAPQLVCDYTMILGIHCITELGGVTIDGTNSVVFP